MTRDLADRGIYGFATAEHLRFADVDANGHVNNGAFLELLENARVSYLRRVVRSGLPRFRLVIGRIEAGRLYPTSPFALTYAIVSTIVRRESALVAELARQVGLLEQRVMAAVDDDPQKFLTALFTARHELLTIHTMASQGGEIYRRAIILGRRFTTKDSITLMKDLLDQYQRVTHISQSQLGFLTGVTEFYRARTDTKMTIAAERLAVIAAVTLPITALSSIYGMNVIVNDHTHIVQLAVVLAVMAAMSMVLLRWTKRQGWW